MASISFPKSAVVPTALGWRSPDLGSGEFVCKCHSPSWQLPRSNKSLCITVLLFFNFAHNSFFFHSTISASFLSGSQNWIRADWDSVAAGAVNAAGHPYAQADEARRALSAALERAQTSEQEQATTRARHEEGLANLQVPPAPNYFLVLGSWGRRTAPFPALRIPHRVPHGVYPEILVLTRSVFSRRSSSPRRRIWWTTSRCAGPRGPGTG